MSAKKCGVAGEYKEVAGGHAGPAINIDESPLSWLVRRKDKEGRPLISPAEFDAGERLRADFYFSQMTPRVTGNWTGLSIDKSARRGAPGFGVDMADNVIAARERVRLALRAAGPELSGVLIDVCCYLKGLEVIGKSVGLAAEIGQDRAANRSCPARTALWSRAR